MCAAGFSTDPQSLVAEGWQRQNVAGEPRLSEAVEAYEGLGYEVMLVPVSAERPTEGTTGSCVACFDADEDPARYQVIYTRRKHGGVEESESLF